MFNDFTTECNGSQIMDPTKRWLVVILARMLPHVMVENIPGRLHFIP